MLQGECYDTIKRQGIWNRQMAISAKELGQVVSSVGQLWLKIQKEAKTAADQLTFNEKCEQIVNFVGEMGKNQKLAFNRIMKETLYELDRMEGPAVKRELKEVAREVYADNMAQPEGASEK
jgi:hypothetical protein